MSAQMAGNIPQQPQQRVAQQVGVKERWQAMMLVCCLRLCVAVYILIVLCSARIN